MTTIPPQTLPNAEMGVPYSYQLDATGGTAPYTWELLTAIQREVLADEPLGFWPLDDAAGSTQARELVADLAGTRYPSNSTAITFGNPGAPGIPSTANIDTTGHFLEGPSATRIQPPFTMELWLYVVASTGANWIMGLGTPTIYDGINVDTRATTRRIGSALSGVQNVAVSPALSVEIDAWHHIALTRAANGDWAIYDNGTQVASGNLAITPGNITRFGLFNMQHTLSMFPFTGANSALFDKPLSPERVAAHYAARNMSSALPDGLTLSAGGLISGTPSGEEGTFTFSAQARDSASPFAQDSRTFTLEVTGPPSRNWRPVSAKIWKGDYWVVAPMSAYT